MNIKHDAETAKKISASNKSRLANKENHSFFGKHHTDATKEKIRQSHIGLCAGEKNPMFGKHHTDATKEKMSEIVSQAFIDGKRKAYGNNNHMCGYFTSDKTKATMHYRSSWELACMKWLDNSTQIQTYSYESIRIPYYQLAKNRKYKRHYVPDFLVTFIDGGKELWEIKPSQFVNNPATQLKTQAAEQYCKENGIQRYRLLTKKDLVSLNILSL
jgi:hypothetical protein